MFGMFDAFLIMMILMMTGQDVRQRQDARQGPDTSKCKLRHQRCQGEHSQPLPIPLIVIPPAHLSFGISPCLTIARRPSSPWSRLFPMQKRSSVIICTILSQEQSNSSPNTAFIFHFHFVHTMMCYYIVLGPQLTL